MSKDGRSFEVKLQATPQPSGVRLDGTAAELASKLSIHADGLLSARPDPVFEGALAVNMPQAQAARERTGFPSISWRSPPRKDRAFGREA